MQIPQNANPGTKSGVYYRLMMRQSMFGRGSNSNINYAGATSQQSSFFNQGASQVTNVWLSYSISSLSFLSLSDKYV